MRYVAITMLAALTNATVVGSRPLNRAGVITASTVDTPPALSLAAQ